MTEKIAEKSVELLESAVRLAEGQVPLLLQEFLNYMIFLCVTDVMKNCLFFLGVAIGVRIINAVIKDQTENLADEETKEAKWKERLDKLDKECTTDSGYRNVRDTYYSYSRRASDLKDNLSQWRMFRSVVILGSALLVGYFSMNSVQRAAKIILAPKIFMLEEGSKLLKGHNSITKQSVEVK